MAPVSTDAAVAVLRHGFVTVDNGRVALGLPPSGWRLKKLPGASQGFYLFLSLSYFVISSFLLLLPVFLLCLCTVLGNPGPQTLWFVIWSSENPYDFGELSLKLCLLMLKGIFSRTTTKNGENPLLPPTAFSQSFLSLCDTFQHRPDLYAL